jgi:hypothetical protein
LRIVSGFSGKGHVAEHLKPRHFNSNVTCYVKAVKVNIFLLEKRISAKENILSKE